MMPIVNGLEAEFQGRVPVIILNVGEPDNERLLLSYGFRGHPAFLVVNDKGEETARFIGTLPGETLAAAMTAVAP